MAILSFVQFRTPIEDTSITPTALLKSSFAHQKIGELDKSKELKLKLQSKYPEYVPETIIPGANDSTAEFSQNN